MGVPRLLHGARDPGQLDRVPALPQPGRVDQRRRATAKIKMDFDRIARRSCDLRDNGDVAAGQSVHQRRFAGVRRPGDDDYDALADALAGVAGRKLGFERLEYRPHQRTDAAAWRLRHVAFVGKIDFGLTQRGGLKQRGAPPLRLAAEASLHLAQRLAALPFGLGLDQIAEPLDLDEINLAVEQRAAREFAGLGRAGFSKSGERLDQARYDRAAAMDVEFGAILARKTARRGKEKDKPGIDRLAARRIFQRGECRRAGLGQAPGHTLYNIGRRGAGKAQYRESGAARAGADREYGVWRSADGPVSSMGLSR